MTGVLANKASPEAWEFQRCSLPDDQTLQELSYVRPFSRELVPRSPIKSFGEQLRGDLTLPLFGVVYVHTLSMYHMGSQSEGIMAEAAIKRIVVQATPQEKRAISAKAKKLGLPVSELMRRGATAYQSAESEDELGAVADAAKAAATRASDAIDVMLMFVEASNKRIAAMEARAGKKRKTA